MIKERGSPHPSIPTLTNSQPCDRGGCWGNWRPTLATFCKRLMICWCIPEDTIKEKCINLAKKPSNNITNLNVAILLCARTIWSHSGCPNYDVKTSHLRTSFRLCKKIRKHCLCVFLSHTVSFSSFNVIAF